MRVICAHWSTHMHMHTHKKGTFHVQCNLSSINSFCNMLSITTDEIFVYDWVKTNTFCVYNEIVVYSRIYIAWFNWPNSKKISPDLVNKRVGMVKKNTWILVYSDQFQASFIGGNKSAMIWKCALAPAMWADRYSLDNASWVKFFKTSCRTDISISNEASLVDW